MDKDYNCRLVLLWVILVVIAFFIVGLFGCFAWWVIKHIKIAFGS